MLLKITAKQKQNPCNRLDMFQQRTRRWQNLSCNVLGANDKDLVLLFFLSVFYICILASHWQSLARVSGLNWDVHLSVISITIKTRTVDNKKINQFSCTYLNVKNTKHQNKFKYVKLLEYKSNMTTLT